MKKELSPEKIEARKAKEANELLKWEKIKSKPMPAHYFAILMVVVTIVYIVDEITSNINSAMQPYVLFDFFNILSRDTNSPEYAAAYGKMFVASLASIVFMIVLPFYRSLADKYGRRLFLMINTCVMGLGLLVIMIAPNIFVYILGVIMLAFVTPNDVQVLYIMEVAPKKHRATLCFVTKAIALVSVSLIGVFMNSFMNSDLSSWRLVYLIPVIMGVGVGLLSIFFTRETPVFIDERMKYLKTTDEERAQKAEEAKKNKEATKGGVLNAIKFIFKHKQTRYAAIAATLFSVAAVYTTNYATIMKGGLTDAEFATAVIVFPFANGLITFIAGFISDKFGRKMSCLTLGSFAMVTLALFILAVRFDFGPYAVGALYGASIGGLWSMSDTLFLTIPGESTPSELRASVMGVMTLLLGVGMGIGGAIVAIGINFVNVGILSLCVCVPFMAIALVLLLTKVHETKDVDLDTVTGLEWD